MFTNMCPWCGFKNEDEFFIFWDFEGSIFYFTIFDLKIGIIENDSNLDLSNSGFVISTKTPLQKIKLSR